MSAPVQRKILLEGLVAPDRVTGIFHSEDATAIQSGTGLDGYFFDGSFYLLPKEHAAQAFDAANKMSTDPETRACCEDADASAFLAVWDVDSIVKGYALIIEGSGGGNDGILNPFYTNDILCGLIEGKDYFTASDAHMTWPRSPEETEKDMDWKEETGSLFRVLKHLVRTPQKTPPAPKPPGI